MKTALALRAPVGGSVPGLTVTVADAGRRCWGWVAFDGLLQQTVAVLTIEAVVVLLATAVRVTTGADDDTPSVPNSSHRNVPPKPPASAPVIVQSVHCGNAVVLVVIMLTRRSAQDRRHDNESVTATHNRS
jgi:hypothetical protein